MPFLRHALLTLFFSLSCVWPSRALSPQAAEATPIRPDSPIERTIRRGETHSYGVSLKRDQFLQLVVSQRGIDVVVRLFTPGGKGLGEFDSPNGTDGPEGLSLVADEDGVYRVAVTPLEQQENSDSGRYEIRILDLRPATEEELESANHREAARAKGRALLAEAVVGLRQLRQPETRARAQVQAAQLLRDSDEKMARELVGEAVEGLRAYLMGLDPEDQNYHQSYHVASQLRGELFQSLLEHDPELALGFLRSTRVLADPNEGQGSGQLSQELQLELSVASRVTKSDPERALRIAEESLGRGFSHTILDTLDRLRAAAPESAVRLAGEIAVKLQGEDLLRNQEAANVAVNLLRVSGHPATNNQSAHPTGGKNTPLLNEQEFRELFLKMLTAGLSYTVSTANFYSVERNSAQMLLTSLNSMTAQMQKYAQGRGAAVEKKVAELNTPPDQQSRLWQKHQERIMNGSFDDALAAAGSAPREMRDQLYQQVASRAAAAGDVTLARQILTEHLTNTYQRQQALRNLTQQAVYHALNGGRLDEALRTVNDLRTPQERAMMLVQIVNQGGSSQKKAALLELLGQARRMMGISGRAEDQEQMNMLFEIGRAYLRLEPGHCFEVIEPLVDQFNSMSVAAEPLNGFGQQFFKDGELVLHNGNSLGTVASQLVVTLGALAASDFDRAKATADRLNRLEARLFAYLSIAQNVLQRDGNEGLRGFSRRGRVAWRD